MRPKLQTLLGTVLFAGIAVAAGGCEDAAKNGAVPAQGDVFLLWRARDLGIFVTDARIEPRFRFD